MNAVTVPNPHAVEARTMTGDEQNRMELQLGKLQSDVEHIQSDVSDLKADLRGTNQRIDDLRKETNASVATLRSEIVTTRSELSGNIEQLRNDTSASVVTLRSEIATTRSGLSGNIEQLRNDTNASVATLRNEIATTRSELSGNIEQLRRSIDGLKNCVISTNRWAIGLYAGLAAGLLFVIAHGLKWL